MRCLIIDIEAMCLDFVLRLAKSGHEVRWYRWNKPGKPPLRDGEGIKGFSIVDEWEPSMPWAKDGLIVVTGNFVHLHALDRYREHGYKIFGPSVASAKLEIDRKAGLDAMQSVGIEVPAFQQFDSLPDVEAFARKSSAAWVFKTLGDENDKSLTYVSKDPADLVGWVQRKIAKGVVLKGPCILQEKVNIIAELGVSGWFGEDGFLRDKWSICFEHKKLCNSEIGPNTGEMATVMQYVDEDKMADECLVPMEPILRALGHVGDFALGAGVTEKGKIVPFEWTARLGYPAFYIQMASHRGDPGKWMRDLLDGKDALRVSNDVALGVVIGQPQFPYGTSKPEDIEGNPIGGVDEIGDAMHPVAMMRARGAMEKDGKVVDGMTWQTTGEYVCVVTGLGKTVEAARKKAYDAVDKIHLPNMIYRTDAGEKVAKALPQLHALGFAESMEAY